MRCNVCGRGFAIDRIATHQRICQKLDAKAKRRRPFRSQRQRVDGEMRAAAAHPATSIGGATATAVTKKSNWRRQHAAFQRAVAAARGYVGKGKGGGGGRKGPPASVMRGAVSSLGRQTRGAGIGNGDVYNLDQTLDLDDDADSALVPCPYCHRTFSDVAAERHIPKCKDMINRPRPPPQLRHQLRPQQGQQGRQQPLQFRSGASVGVSERGHFGTTTTAPSSHSDWGTATTTGSLVPGHGHDRQGKGRHLHRDRDHTSSGRPERHRPSPQSTQSAFMGAAQGRRQQQHPVRSSGGVAAAAAAAAPRAASSEPRFASRPPSWSQSQTQSSAPRGRPGPVPAPPQEQQQPGPQGAQRGEAPLSELSVRQLKQLARQRGVDISRALEKADLVALLV